MSQLSSSPETPGTPSLRLPPVATPMGNPAVVGLSAFGMVTLILEFHNLGLIGVGPVIWVGIVFGGLVQVIAGLQEHKTGNNFGYSAFCSFGCFWLITPVMLICREFDLFPVSNADMGWYLLAWTAYALIMLLGALKISKAMTMTFGTLALGLFLDALHKFDAGAWAGLTAAWVLIGCALLGWYMMAHHIFRSLYDRDILPVGKPYL